MLYSAQLRKLVPVLQKVCDSFGERMNGDLLQVMCVLASELPWHKYLKIKQPFSVSTPIPNNITLERLLRMSSYSLGAYVSDVACLSNVLSINPKDILHFNSISEVGNPSCFLAVDHVNKEIVVSIRGTQSGLDALRDLIIEPSPFSGGLVHSGIRDQANDVITILKPKIERAFHVNPDYRLVFTGHSLGAGAASIATLIIQSSYPTSKAYCFACPSCVSKELLPRLQSHVVTIENMHDIVPRMNSSAMHHINDILQNVNWKELLDSIVGISRKDKNIDVVLSSIERIISGHSTVFTRADELWRGLFSIPISALITSTSTSTESNQLKSNQLSIQKNRKEMRQETKSKSINRLNDSWRSSQTLKTPKKYVSDHRSSVTSIVDQYNEINNSLSLLYNSSRLFETYREAEKKIIQDFRSSVDSLIETYVGNVKSRMDIDKNLATMKWDSLLLFQQNENSVKYVSNDDNDSWTEMLSYSSKQSAMLTTTLSNQISTLELELQKNRESSLRQLETIYKPLLPILSTQSLLSNDPDSSLISDIYSLVKDFLLSVSTKKSEDWFPYPQLYPPGVILHLRKNEGRGKVSDLEMLQLVQQRLLGKGECVGSDTQLVCVEKEEFDHFSLDSPLIEDHRMSNYVWGLCKVFDGICLDKQLYNKCFVC